VRNAVEDAWPVLTALGLVSESAPGTLVVHGSAAAEVEGAQFVQESVPEPPAMGRRRAGETRRFGNR